MHRGWDSRERVRRRERDLSSNGNRETDLILDLSGSSGKKDFRSNGNGEKDLRSSCGKREFSSNGNGETDLSSSSSRKRQLSSNGNGERDLSSSSRRKRDLSTGLSSTGSGERDLSGSSRSRGLTSNGNGEKDLRDSRHVQQQQRHLRKQGNASSPIITMASSRWAGETDTSEPGRSVCGSELKSRHRSSRFENEEGLISSEQDVGYVRRGRGAYPTEYIIQEIPDVTPRANLEKVTYSDRSLGPEPSRAPCQPISRAIDLRWACRSVDEFEKLDRIGEGTYGAVYRARNRKTGEIVAVKQFKIMEKGREAYPLTYLIKEINVHLSCHHPSIVDVREVVVGSTIDSIFMVMDYMEHDLKGFMECMKQPFSQSEVKCFMLQLLKGVKYLHDNWVLHRDLKPSNLLVNNRGELKICDFGLARRYGSSLKAYTNMVVTLWYRAPELLLGPKNYQYSTPVDMWSLGCIMAELLAKKPLFNGQSEIDQIDKIFRTLGTPRVTDWPEYLKLPGAKFKYFVRQPHYCTLRERFRPTAFAGGPTLSNRGFDLLSRLLNYDPHKRVTADEALKHDWFREVPVPKAKAFMPTFPQGKKC